MIRDGWDERHAMYACIAILLLFSVIGFYQMLDQWDCIQSKTAAECGLE